MEKPPLSEYRIVDLSSVLSGPYCTQLLADQGADVIKVEALEGDILRHTNPMQNGVSAGILLSNRNKRSLALDLKLEADKDLLNRLIATADVFVQNFRPGAIQRMGFGEDRVRAIREDIIYVSISGFGDSGPYSGKRVYDSIIQALSGLMDTHRQGDRPAGVNTYLPDKLTAVVAAQAITAALLGRERTGKGDHVKVSMLDATVSWLFVDLMIDQCFPGETQGAKVGGKAPLVVESSDGHLTLMIISDGEWDGFLKASGRLEISNDVRFRSLSDRMVNNADMVEIIRDTIKTGTTEEWITRLEAHHVPCAAVNCVDEVLSDPQIIHNQLIEEFEHPVAGLMRQPRPAAMFDVHKLNRRDPAPMLGEHNTEIVDELDGQRQDSAASSDS